MRFCQLSAPQEWESSRDIPTVHLSIRSTETQTEDLGLNGNCVILARGFSRGGGRLWEVWQRR